MENYLIFFGKSQDFTFEVFDVNGIIKKSNTIFNNFHFLESQIFTVDDASNKEILAKYNFLGSNNKKHSLLKLYSLAQAFDGKRISGSTFGVAFLSTSNLKITSVNNKLLKSLKDEFSKLSLINDKKFNKSNFENDVYRIWEAFSNANYFDKIINTEIIVLKDSSIKQKAFLVNNIITDSIELDKEINNVPRLYFSNDIEHLKRTEKKWGNKFSFFHKVDNNYIKYVEQIIEPTVPLKEENRKSINDYKIENSDLKYDNKELLKELKKSKKYFKRRLKLLTAFSFLLLLTSVTFFFKGGFVFNKGDGQNISETTDKSQKEKENGKGEKRDIDIHTIRINILDNTDIGRLANLQTNLDVFDKAQDNAKPIKVFDAIRRDCDSLGISIIAFDKKYFNLKTKSDSISMLLTSKYLESLSTKIQLNEYLKYIIKTNKEKLSKVQNDTLKSLRLKTQQRIKNAN